MSTINLIRFDFKFDDKVHMFWEGHKIYKLYQTFLKIGLIKKKCWVLILLCLCPVGCLSLEKLNWDSQQGSDLAK